MVSMHTAMYLNFKHLANKLNSICTGEKINYTKFALNMILKAFSFDRFFLNFISCMLIPDV